MKDRKKIKYIRTPCFKTIHISINNTCIHMLKYIQGKDNEIITGNRGMPSQISRRRTVMML